MKNKFILVTFVLSILISSLSAQDTLRFFSKNKSDKDKETEKAKEKESVHQPRYSNSNEIRTLTGRGQSNGFYIGFNTAYSEVYDLDAMSVGGRIAWIANHGVAFGFAGTGFFSELRPVRGVADRDYNYTGGYGGFLVEPILFPKFPVHLSFPVLLGAGGIAKGVYYNAYYPYEYTDAFIENSDAFFIAEPGIELEVNAVRWIRLAVGCTYRFTEGIDPANYPDNPLDGFTYGFSVKFGKF